MCIGVVWAMAASNGQFWRRQRRTFSRDRPVAVPRSPIARLAIKGVATCATQEKPVSSGGGYIWVNTC